MGAVDHQRDVGASGLPHRSVQRPDRRGKGVGAKIEVAEFGSVPLDEGGAEFLVFRRAVLDDDHLVADVVDALLVGPRQRVEGARPLPVHVEEDHDDREVDGVGRCSRRERRSRRCGERTRLGADSQLRTLLAPATHPASTRSSGAVIPRSARKASTAAIVSEPAAASMTTNPPSTTSS